MSHAYETAGRDEHGANRQDGTGDEYGSLSAPPGETGPTRRYRRDDISNLAMNKQPGDDTRHAIITAARTFTDSAGGVI